MIDKRVAIGALARNCDENLPSNIERIEELRRKFSGSAIFVYENNSTDSTKSILKKWNSASNGVYVKSEDIDETPYKSKQKAGRLYRGSEEGRIRKMCVCRNKLLDMICNNGPFDYVIFIDIDIEWFSIDGVVSAIENAPEGWSALFANCFVSQRYHDNCHVVPFYYDTYAFLEAGCDCRSLPLSRINRFFKLKQGITLYNKIQEKDYYRCLSAFGGIGVYQYAHLKGMSYKMFVPSKFEKSQNCICEHIPFNEAIAKRGTKMFIAKEMKVCYYIYNIKGVKSVLLKSFPRLYMLFAELVNFLLRKE